MDTQALRERAAADDRSAAYPFPTGDTGPIGPEAATTIHVLDDAPGARAGAAEERVEDLHEGLEQRAHENDSERRSHDAGIAGSGRASDERGPREDDGKAQYRAETEARVASARRRRRDAYFALSQSTPYDIRSLAIAVSGGFLLGAWWAGRRR